MLSRFIIFIRPVAVYLLILWLTVIIVFSSTPHIPTLKIHTAKSEIRLDYLIHFIEYGVLTFLALLAFEKKDFSLNLGRCLVIIAAVILFSVADEYHQKFIPGRAFNPRDLWSNITGIAGGLAFYILLQSVIRRIMRSG